MTVADRIRAMSDEELARLLATEGAGYIDSSIVPKGDDSYPIDMLEWLKSECSEERSAGHEKGNYRYCEECENFIPLPDGARGGKRGHCKRRYRSDARSGRLRACKLFVENNKRSAEDCGGWIPCKEKLPENAKNPGSFCPKYNLKTKYGKTIGWYNPDFESWFVLIWFMTDRCLTEEIDLERGDVPRVVRASLEYDIVSHWRPFHEP